MAGKNDVLARLSVWFSANAAQFGKDLNSISKDVKGIEKLFVNTGKAIAGAFTGAAIFQGLKQGVSIIAGFEHTMSEVKAITQATGDEFKSLEKDALRLGQATKFTAQEVGQLQVAFGRLGFNTKEIIDATEATLDLAAATGEDLAKSADVAGSTVRGFGLSAKETQRVVDVMASSFNKTALGLDNFTESMKYVAPIAAAANASVEETTALLGVLADAGIRGSSAGTALRKIFGDLAKDGRPLSERLAELSAKGITLSDAYDEVGRTAQTALLVLTKNNDKTKELTESFKHASGEAAEMARIMQDDLIGDVDKLSSAFEGLILKAKETSALRNATQGLTAFINALSGTPDIDEGIRQLVVAIKGESEPAIESFIERLKDVRQEIGKPINLKIIESVAAKYNLTSEQTNKLYSSLLEVNKALSFQEKALAQFNDFVERNGYTDLSKAAEDYKQSLYELILTEQTQQQQLKASITDADTKQIFGPAIKESEEQVAAYRRVIGIINEFIDAQGASAEATGVVVQAQEKVNKGLEYYRAILKSLNEEFDKTDEKDRASLHTLAAKIAKTEEIIKSLERLKALGSADFSVVKQIDGSKLHDPFKAISEGLDRFKKKMKEVSDAAKGVATNIKKAFEGIDLSHLLDGALTGIGEALGGAISGTESLGKGLLRALGGIMTQFGKMLIGVGIGLLGLKKALQSLNPYVAIAAGIALIALGTAVGASVKGLGGGIGGGASGGGTTRSAEAAERASASGTLADRIQFNITGKLTADGRSLALVLNNENVASKRGG